MSANAEFGWLVTATYKEKRAFPIYTVIGVSTAMAAIEYVLTQGFCFSRGCWVLRATQVVVLPSLVTAQSAAAHSHCH